MKILRVLSIAIFALVAGNANASLVANWSFNEISGTIAHDSVGGVNGTLQGGATFTGTGGSMGGGAVNIPMGGYVDMGNNFPATSSFTIEAWIKLASGETSGMVVASKHVSGVGQGYYLSINNVNDGYTSLNSEGFHSMPGTTAVGNVVVNDGQWHELVGVYNNGTNNIFVDGNLAASTQNNGYSDISADFMAGGTFRNGLPTGAFQGLISDVQVYNNALSGADVSALYQSFVQTPISSPVPTPNVIWLFVAALPVFIGFNRRKNYHSA